MMDKPRPPLDQAESDYLFPADEVTKRQRAEIDELIKDREETSSRMVQLEQERQARADKSQRTNQPKVFEASANNNTVDTATLDAQRLKQYQQSLDADFLEKEKVEQAKLTPIWQKGYNINVALEISQPTIDREVITKISEILNELGFDFSLDGEWLMGYHHGDYGEHMPKLDSNYNFMGKNCLIRVFTDSRGVSVILNAGMGQSYNSKDFEVVLISEADLSDAHTGYEMVSLSSTISEITNQPDLVATVKTKISKATEKEPDKSAVFTINNGRIDRTVIASEAKTGLNLIRFHLRNIYAKTEQILKGWHERRRHLTKTLSGSHSDTLYYVAKRAKYDQREFAVEMMKMLMNEARRLHKLKLKPET